MLSFLLVDLASQNSEGILMIPCVVGRIMAPKDVQTLIPGTVKMLPYMAKRDFADTEMGRLSRASQVGLI